jgi:hypothetical protein
VKLKLEEYSFNVICWSFVKAGHTDRHIRGSTRSPEGNVTLVPIRRHTVQS